MSKDERLDEMSLLALAQITDELDGQWTPVRPEEATYLRTNAPAWFRARPAILEVLALEPGSDKPGQKLAERLKRVWMLRHWVDGQPLDKIEAAYGQGEEPATMHLQAAVERTGDLVRAVAGIAATVVPDRRDEIGREMASLRTRLENGVSKAASGLCGLDLALTRHEMRELATTGIATELALLDAVAADDPRLHAALTTPGVHRLRAVIQGRKTGRRRNRESAQQATLLDLFPEGTTF